MFCDSCGEEVRTRGQHTFCPTCLDFDECRSAAHPGVALAVLGAVSLETGETEWSGIVETDREVAVVLMVGDDRPFELEREELEPIGDEDYCPTCGQIGCGHGAPVEV